MSEIEQDKVKQKARETIIESVKFDAFTASLATDESLATGETSTDETTTDSTESSTYPTSTSEDSLESISSMGSEGVTDSEESEETLGSQESDFEEKAVESIVMEESTDSIETSVDVNEVVEDSTAVEDSAESTDSIESLKEDEVSPVEEAIMDVEIDEPKEEIIEKTKKKKKASKKSKRKKRRRKRAKKKAKKAKSEEREEGSTEEAKPLEETKSLGETASETISELEKVITELEEEVIEESVPEEVGRKEPVQRERALSEPVLTAKTSFDLILEKSLKMLSGQEINMNSIILVVTNIMTVVEEFMSDKPGTAKKQMAIQVFDSIVEKAPAADHEILRFLVPTIPSILDSMIDISKGRFNVQQHHDTEQAQAETPDPTETKKAQKCCLIL